MLTQSAVKTALAWSTVARMGFMLLQCGLGLWRCCISWPIRSRWRMRFHVLGGNQSDVVTIARVAKVPPARRALALHLPAPPADDEAGRVARHHQ